MLLQICGKCGCEDSNTQSITISENNFTQHLYVCQRCYTMLMNEQFQKDSKLLNG